MMFQRQMKPLLLHLLSMVGLCLALPVLSFAGDLYLGVFRGALDDSLYSSDYREPSNQIEGVMAEVDQKQGSWFVAVTRNGAWSMAKQSGGQAKYYGNPNGQAQVENGGILLAGVRGMAGDYQYGEFMVKYQGQDQITVDYPSGLYRLGDHDYQGAYTLKTTRSANLGVGIGGGYQLLFKGVLLRLDGQLFVHSRKTQLVSISGLSVSQADQQKVSEQINQKASYLRGVRWCNSYLACDSTSLAKLFLGGCEGLTEQAPLGPWRGGDTALVAVTLARLPLAGAWPLSPKPSNRQVPAQPRG